MKSIKSVHWVVPLIGVACVAGVAAWTIQSSKDTTDMRQATERIAALTANGDEPGLEREPLFAASPNMPSWLLAKKSWLDSGYRISVVRNGANGHTVLNKEDVSHLGYIATSSGTLALAFRREESGRLVFVLATGSNLPVDRE